MNIFEEYKEDYRKIVDLVWLLATIPTGPQEDLIRKMATEPYLKRMRDEINSYRSHIFSTFTVDRLDLEQALATLWLYYEQRWNSFKTKHNSLREYIQQCSIFGMKTWYYSHVSPSNSGDYEWKEEEELPLFTLDLDFVDKGTDFYPLSTLNKEDRYLLFLHFVQELNIRAIAMTLQKDRQTVSNHLKRIENKMKRLSSQAS